MKELVKHLYRIDDGETWDVVGTSPEQALSLARSTMDIDYYEELTAADLVIFSEDEVHRVFLPDFHPLDLDADEYPITPTQDKKGRWFCVATVGQWLKNARPGELISSSIF